MSRFSVLFTILIISFSSLTAQVENPLNRDIKILNAQRISEAPEIDGVLDDIVWQNITPSGDFHKYRPGNEGVIQPEYQSEVKMAYDDKAIYIAAFLYDPNPDAILKQFSQRDDIFVQADAFSASINTYNDGINETRFYVTSAGTIGDSRVSSNGQDFGYNVVFECRISYDEKGWYAEYRIPYNA
ncbi:MAG TPA: hydrolase, partial [Flavobacteriaceae bacterium]|nr:hydrolase [Flavobacteriaceae bacterium]